MTLAEQHRPALTAQSTQAVRSELSRARVVCFFFLNCVYISKASLAQMASGRHTTCKQNIQHGGGGGKSAKGTFLPAILSGFLSRERGF